MVLNKIQQHQNSTAHICVYKAPHTMNFEILVDTFYFCNKLYSYFINIKAELSSEMSLLFAPIKLHFDYCIALSMGTYACGTFALKVNVI